MRRHSRKRDAILAVIRSTDIHPSADWVYSRLRDEYPDISLGTVYRNIAMFREEGSIKSIGVVGGQERFDGCTAPHSHFICSRCGAVLDLHTTEVDSNLDRAVELQHGHRVSGHELVFHGVCAECMDKHVKQ